MASRVLTFLGGVCAVGLAVATAGWESPAVAHTADISRRGRLEFRHASAAAPAAAPSPAGAAAGAGTAPVAAPTPVAPTPAATPPKPEPEPEPEPEIVEITDVELCTVDEAELPHFKMLAAVRIHIDPEGILYWVGASKRTELNTQQTVRINLDKYFDRPLVIVPDRWTNWLYVKDTLDSANAKGVREVYLGGAAKGAETTLRVLRIHPTAADDAPQESDFVIGLSEGDGYAAQITIEGEPLADFPADLALAWASWRKENPGRAATSLADTPVVVEVHKFTPMKQVMPVLGVLRGLGIEAMRLVGDTGYAGRRRK